MNNTETKQRVGTRGSRGIEKTTDTNTQSNVTVIPQNSRRNTRNNSDPFALRREKLKDITNEANRFIDTTYYILNMEDGKTTITSNESLAGAGNNKEEYIQNLIISFNQAIEEFETEGMSDCSIFKIYANQFSFNDSLRQEANFYYSECCISNNQLSEAKDVLEILVEEKMNKDVAPKIIVRLGQIYCLIGEKNQAERYFNKLSKEYPRSEYNQLADCNKL